MQNRKTCVRLTVLAGLLALAASPALAERPMAVDDAGTLERGGAKLEFGWSKDDSVRGLEGAVGFAPIDNVELELGFGRGKDREPSPNVNVRGLGAAVKWVPLQAETGLSAGLKYEYGRERVSGDRAEHATRSPASPPGPFLPDRGCMSISGVNGCVTATTPTSGAWQWTSRSPSSSTSRWKPSARSIPARIVSSACATRLPTD